MPHAFTHNGQVYTPDGKADMTPDQAAAFNADLERAELATWATCPDRWQVYVTDGNASTWQGTLLSAGRVEQHAFRTNISRNMVAIRFKGTNGATYYGRYGADWSQLCRVRKVKGESK